MWQQAAMKMQQMGIYWENNYFFAQMVEEFQKQFTSNQLKQGIPYAAKKSFLGGGVSDAWLAVTIEEPELFSAYWRLENPFTLKREYNEFIRLRYRSASYGFLLDFDEVKCSKLLNRGAVKALETAEEFEEGYKLKQLFVQDEEELLYKKTRQKMNTLSEKIIDDSFNQEMVTLLFEDIKNRSGF